jgi:hypothetical protein
MRMRLASVVVLFVLSAATACAQIEDKQSDRAAPAADSTAPGQEKLDSAAAAPPRKPPLQEHHSTEGVSSAKRAQPGKPPGAGEDVLQRIAQDLAQRLSVTLPALQVLSVESVVWDDGSLGCPQPDQSYTSAQVPGMRVLFAHAGKTYQYHASESGYFLYCPHPAVPAAGEYDRQ